MPMTIVRDDICRMDVDAVVSATRADGIADGGVSAAIFEAAGAQVLHEELSRLGQLVVGRVALTGGYALRATYIVHAATPAYEGGMNGEADLLAACYRSALRLASAHRFRTIAFPLLGAGHHGFPREQALHIATTTIGAYLREEDSDELDVTLVVYDSESTLVARRSFAGLRSAIDDRYVQTQAEAERERWRPRPPFGRKELAPEPYGEEPWRRDDRDRNVGRGAEESDSAKYIWGSYDAERRGLAPNDEREREKKKLEKREREEKERERREREKREREQRERDQREREARERERQEREAIAREEDGPEEPRGLASFASYSGAHVNSRAPAAAEEPSLADASLSDLDAAVAHLDESFSARLLRLIDEHGLTDVQTYKRANIDRKLFSKIRAHGYHPSKPTALALAVALELSVPEARALLECAGYALTRSHKRDVIVEYYIERGVYDIFEINEALFAFSQPLLGAG